MAFGIFIACGPRCWLWPCTFISPWLPLLLLDLYLFGWSCPRAQDPSAFFTLFLGNGLGFFSGKWLWRATNCLSSANPLQYFDSLIGSLDLLSLSRDSFEVVLLPRDSPLVSRVSFDLVLRGSLVEALRSRGRAVLVGLDDVDGLLVTLGFRGIPWPSTDKLTPM